MHRYVYKIHVLKYVCVCTHVHTCEYATFCSFSKSYKPWQQILFCRIPEEEWDKYIIPAKSESEKYKVSRTFSFLMNRMTSPRNKSKVIEVLCLSSIKHRWCSVSAISTVSTFPLQSLTSRFIRMYWKASVFLMEYWPSDWTH